MTNVFSWAMYLQGKTLEHGLLIPEKTEGTACILSSTCPDTKHSSVLSLLAF